MLHRKVSQLSRAFAAMDNDRRILPTIVVGFMELDGRPSLATVQTLVRDRLLPHGRFRMLFQKDPGDGDFYMNEQAAFDLDYHVVRAGLARDHVPEDEEYSAEEVRDVVDKVVPGSHLELDPSRPPWRVLLINMVDGKSCIVFVVDHVVGDGMGLAAVVFDLLDDWATGQPYSTVHTEPHKHALDRPSLLRRCKAFLSGAFRGAAAIVLPGDPPNPLKIKDVFHASRTRVLGLAEPIALDDVKALKDRLDLTVNDVLMGLMVLTFKRYFRETGHPDIAKGAQRVTGQFPVSIRSKRDAELGNRVSFMTFAMAAPLKSRSRIGALRAVKRELDDAKMSPEAIAREWTTDHVASWFPDRALVTVGMLLMNKPSMMLSNVPGPQRLVSLAGAKVSRMYFTAVCPFGVYWGVTSYAGSVQASVGLDPACEPDPRRLTQCWDAEWTALQNEVATLESLQPEDAETPSTGVVAWLWALFLAWLAWIWALIASPRKVLLGLGAHRRDE